MVLIAPRAAVAGRLDRRLAGVRQNLAQVRARLAELRFARPGIADDITAERHRPVDRPEQRRRLAAHGRVLRLHQAVGDELGGGENIAEVVVDLRDGLAERGEPGLLSERLAEVALHGGQLPLGDPDFVVAAGRPDAAAPVFGRRAELHDLSGQPAHRADHHPLQRQIEQDRRDAGNHQRQLEDALRIFDQRLSHRLFGQDRADQDGRVLRRAAGDAQDDVPVAQQGLEGVEHHLRRRLPLQVDDDVRRRRRLGPEHARHQWAEMQVDGVGADMAEKLGFERRADLAVRVRFEREAGQMRVRQPVGQVHDPEPPRRRRENQHLRRHYEGDGHHEQARGQAGEQFPHDPRDVPQSARTADQPARFALMAFQSVGANARSASRNRGTRTSGLKIAPRSGVPPAAKMASSPAPTLA